MPATRSRAQLLIIDVQDKLAPHVEGQAAVIANCGRLIRYAKRLDVPITITEHYPKGLGPTCAELATAAGGGATVLEKIAFSSLKDEAIASRLRQLKTAGRDQITVAGMEAHVCVCQTVLDLLQDGFHTLVVADAVGSRVPEVRQLALNRMARAGAEIVSHEMIAFEWLGRGDLPEFKDLIVVIK
ncbi:MAG: hydrolase [Hyphomicrobiaceae bacterium]